MVSYLYLGGLASGGIMAGTGSGITAAYRETGKRSVEKDL
jgi:hypothetical protein